jgi:hypothetical protein
LIKSGFFIEILNKYRWIRVYKIYFGSMKGCFTIDQRLKCGLNPGLFIVYWSKPEINSIDRWIRSCK